MSLRNQVLILLSAVFLTSGILEHAVQHFVVYPSFLELENARAIRNMDRAVQALQRDLDLLTPAVNDWAWWDEAYRFVQNRNKSFAATNLNPAALQGLAVNVLAFYNLKGNQIWSGIRELSPQDAQELPLLIPPHLSDDHFLKRRGGFQKLVSGLFKTHQGPFLVAAMPVLNSARDAPPKGIILMARFVGPQAVTRLNEQIRVDLKISEPLAEAHQDLGLPEPGKLLHTPFTLEAKSNITLSKTTLMDLEGKPALTLTVAIPRDISARGWAAILFADLFLGVVGIIVLLSLIFGLRRIILKPLSRLTRHASLLGTTDNLKVYLNFKRKDEIGTLARTFDLMTDRLEQAQQRLLEHSYRSGIAEMASGVLHNIGNAITPIGVKLNRLRDNLEQAPTEEVPLALEALADPDIDPARRADMQKFIALASQELATVIQEAAPDLIAIQAQVDHIQQILLDQNRFSRAERIVEAVAIHPVLLDSISLLPEALRERIEIKLESDLSTFPPVQASRVVIKQIFSNLLINAAEAINELRDHVLPGQILIKGQTEVLEDNPMIHLQIIDNGIGIASENLPRIFESGFSTKNRGSGMGLHWTANSVLVLGGRITAESKGMRQGACLHLWLPLCEDSVSLHSEESF